MMPLITTLEFNCMGTTLVGYGPFKNERNSLPAPIVEQITTHLRIARQARWKISTVGTHHLHSRYQLYTPPAAYLIRAAMPGQLL